MAGKGKWIAVAGAAVGTAAGVAVRRARNARRLESDEPLGNVFGRPVTVRAADGVEIAADVDDGPEDLAIVFAHGWILNRHSWHHQRKALAGAGTLVFYDHRGHGGSATGPSESLDLEQLGEDLLAVMDATVPPGTPTVLVGHSMGGMTIMALAAKHPELFGDRIIGTALMNTSSGGLRDLSLGLPEPLARRTRPAIDWGFGTMRARAALVERFPRVRRAITFPVTRYTAFGPAAQPHHVRFINEMCAATPVDALVGCFNSMMAHDQRSALAALGSVETLVIGAERDRLTPPSHARLIAREVDGAHLRVLPLAGHMSGLEQPDAVNRALTDFLGRVRARQVVGSRGSTVHGDHA